MKVALTLLGLFALFLSFQSYSEGQGGIGQACIGSACVYGGTAVCPQRSSTCTDPNKPNCLCGVANSCDCE
jgi:hypothetical protein